MIKGVNKQVLEINETQNGFFEKAIFFVKPEYSGMSEGKLRESAKKEVENAGTPPSQRFPKSIFTKSWLKPCILFFSGLIAGIIFSALF